MECVWCDRPILEEFADPNAKDICVFCVETGKHESMEEVNA